MPASQPARRRAPPAAAGPWGLSDVEALLALGALVLAEQSVGSVAGQVGHLAATSIPGAAQAAVVLVHGAVTTALAPFADPGEGLVSSVLCLDLRVRERSLGSLSVRCSADRRRRDLL